MECLITLYLGNLLEKPAISPSEYSNEAIPKSPNMKGNVRISHAVAWEYQ